MIKNKSNLNSFSNLSNLNTNSGVDLYKKQLNKSNSSLYNFKNTNNNSTLLNNNKIKIKDKYKKTIKHLKHTY
jgi:hypothetical protein